MTHEYSDDLAADGDGTLLDGEHRHAGGGVVVAEGHRQRPVVRRRPEEDDEEEDDGRPPTVPVTADQPMSVGMQPATPPQTMFCDVRRLSSTV